MKKGSDASARPVWIMPVLSGTPACFGPLLDSIPSTKRTIYGLLDPYLAGHDEALAMAYMDNIALEVDAIQSTQPTGPYTLAGYSQGVTWMWAAAEILIKRGQQVDEILCLDPNFPNWSNFDRVLEWDGPQMAYGTGMPLCLLKCIMPLVFVRGPSSLLPGVARAIMIPARAPVPRPAPSLVPSRKWTGARRRSARPSSPV